MAVKTGTRLEVRVVLDDLPRIRKRFQGFVQAAIAKATIDTHGLAVTKAPVDTGNLKNSITSEMDVGLRGVFSGTVYTAVEYAPYVEYGTRFMGARPFMGPAHAQVERSLVAAFRAIERQLGGGPA